MLAIVAAVIFGIGLLVDFADVSLGDAFTDHTLMMAGLFCLALHFSGVGTTTRFNSRRGNRR